MTFRQILIRCLIRNTLYLMPLVVWLAGYQIGLALSV